MSDPPPAFDAKTRRALLTLVRQTADQVLSSRPVPGPARPKVPGRFGGAFVTFYHGGALRGCIGTFLPTTDIVSTLEEVTRSSLADPRFRDDPITLAELPALTIEISVLSDPAPTREPDRLTPGIHGIIVRRGAKSGCFLPRVATDRGWSAEEFLSQCCTMKAGLPADAWRGPETEVDLFSAESFSDTPPRTPRSSSRRGP